MLYDDVAKHMDFYTASVTPLLALRIVMKRMVKYWWSITLAHVTAAQPCHVHALQAITTAHTAHSVAYKIAALVEDISLQ
jgi:hypothetical protein